VRAQLRLTPENLPEYLRNRGLRPEGEAVRVEPAGDGNINWVRRVRLGSGGRSVVVKQARPALERFPEYAVTTERIVFEARYYETVRPFDAAGLCPRVLDFDETERVLVLEDLGDATRLDHVLLRRADAATAQGAGEALGRFLGTVHAGTAKQETLASRFANDEMRRLHGDHIFALPFRPNDFPLPPALRARAAALWRDEATVALADAAYRDYLAPAGVLVHADVQGGNVLLQRGRPRLLDAEISHAGDGAFDVGILLAHLAVSDAARGDAAGARPALGRTWAAYLEGRGRAQAPPFERALRFAGIELVRRTLGAARVEAVAEDAAGIAVLDLGLRWLRTPAVGPATAV
jgi:5-methylthioribose kinase